MDIYIFRVLAVGSCPEHSVWCHKGRSETVVTTVTPPPQVLCGDPSPVLHVLFMWRLYLVNDYDTTCTTTPWRSEILNVDIYLSTHDCTVVCQCLLLLLRMTDACFSAKVSLATVVIWPGLRSPRTRWTPSTSSGTGLGSYRAAAPPETRLWRICHWL